jgi:hypothetical protein
MKSFKNTTATQFADKMMQHVSSLPQEGDFSLDLPG